MGKAVGVNYSWIYEVLRRKGALEEESKVRNLRIEIEQEEDGRWIAEAPDFPGVLANEQTREEAVARVEALALRVLADRLEQGEPVPEVSDLAVAAGPC
jgi:predicted RNase H-like HicB family nuclease